MAPPSWIDDVIGDRAGIVPAVLLGAATGGGGALMFKGTRDHALLMTGIGAVVGAAFHVVRQKACEEALPSRSVRPMRQQTRTVQPHLAAQDVQPTSQHDAAMNVLQLLAAQESGRVAPSAVIPALRAFQSVSALPVTGTLDAQTQAALMQAVRSGYHTGLDVPWWAPLSPAAYAASRATPPNMPYPAFVSPVVYAERLADSSFWR
jgi:hypothetical protein